MEIMLIFTMSLLLANSVYLTDHWKELKKITYEIDNYTGNLPVNSLKNRYYNILPNEETRVVLQEDRINSAYYSGDNASGTDYINANHIAGTSIIMAMCPMTNTIDDFFLMVFEQNVEQIVVILNERDLGNARKAYQYWLSSKTAKYLVEASEKEEINKSADVSTIKITSKEGACRVVKLYHYHSWPDHGVPEAEDEISDLRSLVHMVSASVQSENSDGYPKTVVHCSAGLGRSGVFVAALLAYKNSDRAVKDIVIAIRKSRHHQAVQNRRQYDFLISKMVRS